MIPFFSFRFNTFAFLMLIDLYVFMKTAAFLAVFSSINPFTFFTGVNDPLYSAVVLSLRHSTA